MESPAKRMRLSMQQRSVNGRQSTGTPAVGSGLRTSTVALSGRSIPQPSQDYDIITGQPTERPSGRPPSRQETQIHPLRKSGSRQSMLPKPAEPVAMITQQKHKDELHALSTRINKLEYELSDRDSEKHMIALQHEKEMRDLQVKADDDYRKYQEAESERLKAVRASEQALREAREARDDSSKGKSGLLKDFRQLQQENATLQEDRDNLEAALHQTEDELQRSRQADENVRKSLQQSVSEKMLEMDELRTKLEQTEGALSQRDKEHEVLERELAKFTKQGSGGEEELELLRKELNEQITHVRRLEIQNREMSQEIRKFKDERKSVNVVMEEKKTLELQVKVLREVERRASELEIQKELLEDEKRVWTSLLERDDHGQEQQEFDSPEEVVKALVSARLEQTLALERLGAVEVELTGREEEVKTLETEKNSLQDEITLVRQQATENEAAVEVKAMKRADTQKQLMQKEIDYLKAQLDAAMVEQATMSESVQQNDSRGEQISSLEELVQQQKIEIDALQGEVSRMKSQPAPPTPTLKRSAPDPDAAGEDSQAGQLARKNKTLQMALQKTTQQSQLLATELQAVKSQLKALRNSTKTRILQLNDNPTAQQEAIKMSTLRTLKQENSDLLGQLQGQPSTNLVPASTLESLRLELADKDTIIRDREKTMRRQREIWTLKAAEFRDSIASILGFQVYFAPNGKVKIMSEYYHGPARPQQSDLDEREDFIEFDADKGTMKVGGGVQSAFGREIEALIQLWIRDKREIPCLLAALTLQFYEEYGGGAEG